MSVKLHRQIRTSIMILKRSEDPGEHPNKMTTGERNVFLCLATVGRDDGTSIYCGVDFVCNYTGLSRVWVQKCLRKLEYKGYIVPVANQKGGRGRPTMYHIPLDTFGIITPKPPEPMEEADTFLDTTDQAPGAPAPSTSNLPTVPETPAPGDAPLILTQTLVALEVGTDLQQICQMYSGLINLQAVEEKQSKKWWDYQKLLRQARDSFNQALASAGIVASDGHSPPIDDELEQQMQAWSRRVQERQVRRDSFEVGTDKWVRWDDMTRQAVETFNSMLYIEQISGGIPVT